MIRLDGAIFLGGNPWDFTGIQMQEKLTNFAFAIQEESRRLPISIGKRLTIHLRDT